jgi:hypothetical protein
MVVKEILSIATTCPADTAVSVAVVNGAEMTVYPAVKIQVLANNVDGKIIRNLIVITEQQSKV